MGFRETWLGETLKIRVYPTIGGLTKKGPYKGYFSVMCSSRTWHGEYGDAPLNVFIVGERFHRLFKSLGRRHFERYVYEVDIDPREVKPSFYPPPWETARIREEYRRETTKTPPLTKPYWMELKERFLAKGWKPDIAYYYVWVSDTRVTCGGKPI